MTEPSGADETPDSEQWILVVDPAWQSTEDGRTPPDDVVVGGWFVGADGEIGRFEANPGYRPSGPDAPADPVDAVLRMVVRGEADVEQLMAVSRATVLSVAVDDEGLPVVAPAPDDVPSVLVTTAPLYRALVDVPGWTEVVIDELAEALPDEGIDVFFNPGAPAALRVLASAVRGEGKPRYDREAKPNSPGRG